MYKATKQAAQVLMSDEMLSQAEIEALFNAAAAGDDPPSDSAEDTPPAEDSPPASPQDFEGILSDIEKDALGEIGNISMGSAATTLSTLLSHKVSITTPSVSVATMSVIKESYPMPFIIVEVGYTIGIEGNNILAIQASDAAIIADLMMGGDGTNPDPNLSEIHMSAVGESMNQMMGAVATSLSTMFNKKIDISPPIVNLVDFGKEDAIDELIKNPDPIVKISFRMEVDGLIDSEIMQILPLHVAQGMVRALMGGELDDSAPAAESAPAPEPAATSSTATSVSSSRSVCTTTLSTATTVPSSTAVPSTTVSPATIPAATVSSSTTLSSIWTDERCYEYASIARAVYAAFYDTCSSQRSEYWFNLRRTFANYC